MTGDAVNDASRDGATEAAEPMDLLAHVVVVTIATVHDITARTRAEHDLREARAKLAALIASVPDVVIELDAHGVVQNGVSAE